jgi:hypothetical protein
MRERFIRSRGDYEVQSLSIPKKVVAEEALDHYRIESDSLGCPFRPYLNRANVSGPHKNTTIMAVIVMSP